MWQRGEVDIATAQLHLTKPELKSVHVQILIMACQRLAMVKISGNGSSWK